MDFTKGGWVASAQGPSGLGFRPRIAKVKQVYELDGETLLDLIFYSYDGEKIGRESPAMGGPTTFEPCCGAEFWEPIAQPDFDLLTSYRYSYGFHLDWKRPHPEYTGQRDAERELHSPGI